MDALSVVASAVQLSDSIFRIRRLLRDGPKAKAPSDMEDISADLERLQSLLRIHTGFISTTDDKESLKALQSAMMSVYPPLDQIDSRLLQHQKRLDRMLSRGRWKMDRDNIHEDLRKAIRALEISLFRFGFDSPLHLVALLRY
jgi:hypothetical protein